MWTLFTAVIVLTLALGLGSNVAMFSVAEPVLLRALPYDHPQELALVWTRPIRLIERASRVASAAPAAWS